jgi:hypothetical protein
MGIKEYTEVMNVKVNNIRHEADHDSILYLVICC